MGWGCFSKRMAHSPLALTLSPGPNPIDLPNSIPIPNPIYLLNPIPRPTLRPTPRFFCYFSHSPGFELQTSDFEVHLHLHYATQLNQLKIKSPTAVVRKKLTSQK